MFSDINARIEANRQRLKEELDNIRSIQNSYPLFFAYLAFIGIYLVDYIEKIGNLYLTDKKDIILLVLVISTSLLVAISIYKFILLFYPKKVAYDKMPKEIYGNLYKEFKEYQESTNENIDIDDEVRKAYLSCLEEAVEHNFLLYQEKRHFNYHVILFALISLIPYSILIIIKIFTL